MLCPIPFSFYYREGCSDLRQNKRKDTRFIIMCLTPAMLCIVFLFAYPVLRTGLMSFHTMDSFTDGFDKWAFVGSQNYSNAWKMPLFSRSFVNLLLIWVAGGLVTLSVSLFYAVVISSGVKAKAFWRSIVYLPNIISMVALAAMWTQYIYNTNFGLLTSVFRALGLNTLAGILWTDEKNIFWSMVFSFCFGCVGYYLLIFLAGIDRIPQEIYESAYIDGAGRIRSFFSITLPLLRGIIRTGVALWTITTANFFVWSLIYTRNLTGSTAVPGVLMYNLIFGSRINAVILDPGAGAVVGVLVTLSVMAAYGALNLFFPERRLEY